MTLAGLSADPAVQFRVWGHAGALCRQLGRSTDALAADDAARCTPISRRDPLYASLAHLAHAQLGQDDLEPAVATALKVPAETRHGRISGLLDAFDKRLTKLAPHTAETRQWLEAQAARTEKSTSP